MATYPTALRIAPRSTGGGGSGGGTQHTWRDPMLLSISRANTTRARRLGTVKKNVWQISHVNLTATEKGTLETFYDANRAITFTFTVLGVNYTAIFGDDIQWEGLTFNLWNARVTIVEV